eukprot:6205508-Pleurochrysis_carterae.AAC.1
MKFKYFVEHTCARRTLVRPAYSLLHTRYNLLASTHLLELSRTYLPDPACLPTRFSLLASTHSLEFSRTYLPDPTDLRTRYNLLASAYIIWLFTSTYSLLLARISPSRFHLHVRLTCTDARLRSRAANSFLTFRIRFSRTCLPSLRDQSLFETATLSKAAGDLVPADVVRARSYDPEQRCMVFNLDYDRRSDLDDSVGYWCREAREK